MKIGFFYDFRPVGQGLFAIGKLTRVKDSGAIDHFTWVHDCGSNTLTSTAMTKEIEALRRGVDRPPLDLLILSHFDEDHISGLILLLGTFRVRRLVLPYFTPAERLSLLLGQNPASGILGRFLAGPSAFIQSYQGGQETEILFVRKSDEPSPPPSVPDNPPDNPIDLGRVTRVTKDEGGKDPDLSNALGLGSAVLMKDGSIPLTIWGHWEFCFYNLPQPSDKLSELWACVQADFDLFAAETRAGGNPEPILRKMKLTYREIFGSSAAGRNDISLVTYTGPALSKLSGAGLSSPPLSPLYLSSEETRPVWVAHHKSRKLHFAWSASAGWTTGYEDSKASLLYTGDISLNDARVDEIQRLLTPARWDAVQALQVPHHGASSSWTAGLSAKFGHRYSVFSSARYHPIYRHPREEVLTDLKDTACVLVNEYAGAVFHGGARWEKGASPKATTD